MNIIFQGRPLTTAAATVAALLAEQGIDAESAIVEFNGDICQGEAALHAPLAEGSTLDVFRIVTGG
ncbi:hypothetical protein SDC9_102539 [bioreactor metagenome]|uniref:Thiamine biosynthesis protein ThiS n=1 Tax=bioreactor metagenome TaxID=1076179 RepID=A0A645AR58_9ZZZZ